MQLSAPEPTPRARINWILEEKMLRKMEVAVRERKNSSGNWEWWVPGENPGEKKVRGNKRWGL